MASYPALRIKTIAAHIPCANARSREIAMGLLWPPFWRAALLALALLSLILLTLARVKAQEESRQLEGLPDVLLTQIEELSEDLPELLDISWKEYKDRDVTIWLPDSFEQPVIEGKLVVLDEGSALSDPELQPLFETLVSDAEMFRFAAFDQTNAEAGHLANISVTRQPMLVQLSALVAAKTYETMLRETLAILVEPNDFELERYDAAYMVVLLPNAESPEAISFQYYIVDGFYLYVVTFGGLPVPDQIEYNRAVIELALETLIFEREDSD